jgi:preprotein translocase subunit SecA
MDRPAAVAVPAWFAPRDPAQPRGSLAWRLRRLARHLARRDRAALEHEVRAAQASFPALAEMGEEAFRAHVAQVRRAYRLGRAQRTPGQPELTAALATVAAAAKRTLGMTPSFPQFLAALAMADSYAVQLAPGEGKTLAVAMAAVLQAWDGRPCHVVTANEYLAARDVELVRPLYVLCGCSAAAVTQEMERDRVAPAYACEIVYATAPQLLADFLRDQLLLGGASTPVQRRLWRLQGGGLAMQPVMRGLYAAIIDEADGVLVDEATTPLIIASPQANPLMVRATHVARTLVDAMERDVHYTVHQAQHQDVRLTEAGEDWLDTVSHELPEFWQQPDRRENLVCMALLARDVFERDRHYVVQQGRVVIVDENTGRLMPDRSWSHGIHQAIEAREGLELTDPSQTAARMTFQEFFRRYHVLSGASGTLQGIARELWSTYGLLTLRLAPRVPSRLRTGERHVFRTREEKLEAIVAQACLLHREGLPVLVGTRRILDSEAIAERLRAAGVECEVLNAKKHEEEAQIVARAGAPHCVTVATNMAGRGTDIMLAPGVADAGGLQVLSFEAHESARVDWQLFGRSGRQGAPGRAQAFIALGDELFERHLPAPLLPLLWSAAAAPVTRRRFAPALVWSAQWQAQRRAWGARRTLAEREAQVIQQLSFSRQA